MEIKIEQLLVKRVHRQEHVHYDYSVETVFADDEGAREVFRSCKITFPISNPSRKNFSDD